MMPARAIWRGRGTDKNRRPRVYQEFSCHLMGRNWERLRELYPNNQRRKSHQKKWRDTKDGTTSAGKSLKKRRTSPLGPLGQASMGKKRRGGKGAGNLNGSSRPFRNMKWLDILGKAY